MSRLRPVRGVLVAGLIGVLFAGCGGGSSTPTTPPTTTTTTPAHSAADAVEFVKKIYEPYMNWTVTTPTLGNCFGSSGGRPCIGRVGDYVTPGLRAKLLRYASQGTGSDPVGCAQNSPVQVTYAEPRVKGTTATIVVHTHYASGDRPVMVAVDLNSLKLADLSCPNGG